MMRISLFITCFNDTLFPEAGRATVQVLVRLVWGVRGIEVVDLPDAEQCCGFGGTFAIKNADTSMAMLGDKLRAIRDTQAEVCVAADTSCLMHIGGALHRQRAGVRTMHIAEVLACTEETEAEKQHE